MENRGYKLNYSDLVKDRLSVSELQKLIGTHDHEDFLNPRSEIFRKKKMKDDPPSRREAISLMAKNPDLIRRPVVRSRRARGHRIRRKRNDPVLARLRAGICEKHLTFQPCINMGATNPQGIESN